MNKEEVDQFLKQFKTKEGTPYEVPVEGSLGLLALGDIGLFAWKQKQQQIAREKTIKANRANDE